LGGLKSVLLFDLYGLSSNHKIREDARLVRNTIREGVKEPDIRITAARALGKQGDPNAIEPLFKACMDENCGVKSAARDALALIVAQMHSHK